jgi:CubicO group peptidase (beta-lactamase class C family)
MADLQAEVQAAAGEMVDAGTETGLQVAVLRHGRVVAEVVSGVEDPQDLLPPGGTTPPSPRGAGAPVTPGTLFYAASTAKGVAASLAHVLAERGDIPYDLRLASVWPEFAACGKERTTLRHVLLHTAGLPGLPRETTVADLCDWDRMCAGLAAAEPWWEPGTRFGYHALTFGFLLGETLRRVTCLSVSELLREVLTGPLGVADEVCFAVPRPLLPRVARQAANQTPPPPPEQGSPLDRATPPALRDVASFGNRADVLTADIPSLGTMTARGAARMYSALLGHVDGISLVSSQRRTAMAAVAFTGMDEVMSFPSSWAFGYSPDRPGGVPSRRGSTFGMVGANGSAAYADIDSGLAVAVMRNGPADGGLAAVTRIDRLIAGTEEYQ